MAARATGHVKLVQRQRGSVFYAKYRLPAGRHPQRLLGPAWLKRGRPPEGYFTRELAAAELHRILADADRGYAGGQVRRTFREACDEWLRYVEHDKERAASTLRGYRNIVNGRLVPAFGAVTALAVITTDDVDAYRERQLEAGKLARRTIQQDMVILHGIYKRAKRRKWIAANPSENAERVTVTKTGEFRVLSVEQVEACARASATPQLAAIIRVAAYTGLRLGELRALRWRDVDFAKSLLHVRRNLPRRWGGEAPEVGQGAVGAADRPGGPAAGRPFTAP